MVCSWPWVSRNSSIWCRVHRKVREGRKGIDSRFKIQRPITFARPALRCLFRLRFRDSAGCATTETHRAVHWVATDAGDEWGRVPGGGSRSCKFCKSGNHPAAAPKTKLERATFADRRKPESGRIVHAPGRGRGKDRAPRSPVVQ